MANEQGKAIYQILKWTTHFEGSGSLKLKQKPHGFIPLKQSGLGYLRMMATEDPEANYGSFVATVVICHQQMPPRKGWLTADGKPTGDPYDAVDIAQKASMNAEKVQAMLDLCSSPRIGWIRAWTVEQLTDWMGGKRRADLPTPADDDIPDGQVIKEWLKRKAAEGKKS